MSFGTPEHAAIAAQTTIRLGSQLKPGCQTFSSDARIHVEATGLSTYPDVSVVCGTQQRATKDPLELVNPTVLVEVTSSLHAQRRVTVVAREGAGWGTRDYRPSESFSIPGVNVTLEVDELYGSILPTKP